MRLFALHIIGTFALFIIRNFADDFPEDYLSPRKLIAELIIANSWSILLTGCILWGLISIPVCIIHNKWELIRVGHKQVHPPQNDSILEAARYEVEELLKTN